MIRWRVVVLGLGLFYTLLALHLVVFWMVSPTWALADTKPVVVHTYNYRDSTGTVSSWQGEEIVSNGFCIEIILNGRTDTILCPSHFITEAVEKQPGQEQPSNPDAIEPLPNPPNRQANWRS